MARLFRPLAALVLTLTLLSPAALTAAPGDEARLDQLFGALAQAENSAEAELIEVEIWRVWADSGSDTADLLMRRGLEAMESQDYAIALDMFSTVIDLQPDYAEGWNKRATLFFLIEDFEAAISDATHTLALEPRHWPALMGLAIIFEELGQPERALGAYRAALEINPQIDSAHEAVRRLEVEVEGRGI